MQSFSGFSSRNLLTLPQLHHGRKIIRYRNISATKSYASGFGSSNTFRLPFFDIMPFGFCHIAKDLQHYIGKKFSQQIILGLLSIKQRHIQNNYINIFFFGNVPPFLLNLRVIAAQSVQGSNIHAITRLQALDQPFVSWSLKIFTAFLIYE